MANILGFLKKAAPWVANAIATTVPGPIGIVAGIVAKHLPDAKVEATPNSVMSTLEPLMQTEDGRLKLAQIEADTKSAMNALNIKELDDFVELSKVESDDRANARQMATTRDIWTPRFLTAFVCGMVAFITTVTVFGITSKLSMAEATTLAGYGGYIWRDLGTMFSFWFGDSSANQEKTKVIADLAKSAQQ